MLWYGQRMARRRSTSQGGRDDESNGDSDDDSGDFELESPDFGEVDDHDAADRERFSSETAHCPECGAEVWDAADICPKCYAWIDGDTQTRTRRAVHHPLLRQIVVWLLIAAFVLGAGFLSLLALI